MTAAPNTLAFSYWTDPLCIWAFVARTKLDQLRTNSDAELHVSHRIVPVFGSVVQRFRDGSWAEAGPDGRAASTRRVAEQFGHTNITGQVWIDDAPASSWSPSLAIKSIFLAEAAGEVPAGTAETFQWRLRECFFIKNLNIARRQIQLEVAESCDISARVLLARIDDGRAMAALFEDYEEKQNLGVRGSPTYVFDGAREVLYGNVPYELIQTTVNLLLRDGMPGCSACQ